MANTGDILLREQGDFDDVMGTSVWLKGTLVVGDIGKPVKVDPLNDDTVVLAGADLSAAEPALGILVAIDDPAVGSCIVRSLGFVSGYPAATFTRGKRYILGRTLGTLVAADDTLNPDYPLIGTSFKQTVGVAKSDTALMVMVDPTTFEI